MSPKIKICKEVECNDQATTKGYCRFHYLKNWNRSRNRKKRAVAQLNRYVETIIKSHPGDYLTEISKDVTRWQDGGNVGAHDDFDALEDLGPGDSLDQLIDNLKVDDDY